MKLDILLKLDDIVITMKTMWWLCRPASGGLMNTVQLLLGCFQYCALSFETLPLFLSADCLAADWAPLYLVDSTGQEGSCLEVTRAQCSELAAVWTWAQLTLFFASNDNRLSSHSEYSHWQGLVPMEMGNRPGSCFFLFFLPAWKGLSCCSSIYSARHKELFFLSCISLLV